jgi:dolichol-phosphate mannosyltransferase
MTDEHLPEITVVVPFYNEEACVVAVVEEVVAVLDRHGQAYEIVAVDDGSRDATPRLLAGCAARHPQVRVLRWEGNRGQAAALYWGLKSARAPVVVTMDGDGQNDPADIPTLLAGLAGFSGITGLAGADMVVGIRAARSDSRLRRAMSRLANGVRGRVLHDHLHDSGCALKVFRRELVDTFLPIQTLYSFLPAFAVAAGFRVAERPVRHRHRQGGTSSYGLRKMLWRPLLDMLGVWWFRRRRFLLPREAGAGPAVRVAVVAPAAPGEPVTV